MMEKKESVSLKINRGSVRFGDNAKREFIGVDCVKIEPSYDLMKVCIVYRLKHNRLSISQLYNVGFDILLNIVKMHYQ